MLVTGHSGFKGSWLSLWLQEMGAQVSGISRGMLRSESLHARARVGEGMAEHMVDVTDRKALAHAIAAVAPEVVFHLAAQALEGPSFDDPLRTYRTNVIGAVNVLDAVRTTPSVGAAVVVTSDRAYEPHGEDWPYRENEPLGGATPYSSSKGSMELIAASYRRSYWLADGPRLATARTGNVIGGGDWTEGRLVPDLLRGTVEGKPVELRHPDALRPWLHVLDPLCGYLLLAERLWDDRGIASSWNFSPGEVDIRAVGWVADRLAELWGEGLSWHAQPNAPPDTAPLFRLDSSRARRLLGWVTRSDIDDTMRAIIDFHRREQDGADLHGLMSSQIDEFVASEG